MLVIVTRLCMAYQGRSSWRSPQDPPPSFLGRIPRTRHKVPPAWLSVRSRCLKPQGTYGEQDVSDQPSDMLRGSPSLGVSRLDRGRRFLHPLDQGVEDGSDRLVIASPFVQCKLLDGSKIRMWQ